MGQIAVFFPGIGYHCDKPLLYYSRALAQEAGYRESIQLHYTCDIPNLRGNPAKMREAGLALFAQAEQTLNEVPWDAYDEILFISKSVGTALAAAYAREHGIDCRNVFYTPVALTFQEGPRRGIAFTGTSDPWVETAVVTEGCQRAGIPLTVIEDGNHSLETEDPVRNLEILKTVMEKTRAYIRREGGMS